MSVSDLEDNIKSGFINRAKSDPHIEQGVFELPSVKVKNWASLRKHAAEVLVYASPRKYAQKVRNICVSRPEAEIEAYLKSMYKIDTGNRFFCQMCHEPVSAIEKWKLTTGIDKELDSMNLCLCRNCASKYRLMRSNVNDLNDFVSRIKNLDEQHIQSQDPVKIKFGNESIWVTQTHIAEIRELLILMEKADENNTKTEVHPKQPTIEGSKAGGQSRKPFGVL